jgi:hypothetical protein
VAAIRIAIVVIYLLAVLGNHHVDLLHFPLGARCVPWVRVPRLSSAIGIGSSLPKLCFYGLRFVVNLLCVDFGLFKTFQCV